MATSLQVTPPPPCLSCSSLPPSPSALSASTCCRCSLLLLSGASLVCTTCSILVRFFRKRKKKRASSQRYCCCIDTQQSRHIAFAVGDNVTHVTVCHMLHTTRSFIKSRKKDCYWILMHLQRATSVLNSGIGTRTGPPYEYDTRRVTYSSQICTRIPWYLVS